MAEAVMSGLKCMSVGRHAQPIMWDRLKEIMSNRFIIRHLPPSLKSCVYQSDEHKALQINSRGSGMLHRTHISHNLHPQLSSYENICMVNDKGWGFVGKVRQIGKQFLGDRHDQRQTPIHYLNNSAALHFQHSTLQSMTCLIGVANCFSAGRRPLELFQASIEKFRLCELCWCVLKDQLLMGLGKYNVTWYTAFITFIFPLNSPWL